MKIKTLHLRNIASIEKADIDFEHGLNDPMNGQPASIFLISGDTGSGKSVLLDGISMALFKTTPRIENVSAKKNNEFRNSSGEAISIFSLEQYTRLGISDKDECYSELIFEGNDGRDYTARITLGMARKRQKDSDGQLVIEHKTPVWTLRCGEAEWSKDRDITEQIKNAIGLSFEQFNRMAMLAQGQFANFLCGGRDERSAILEQLTNTQQFTRYGKVIHKLFTDTKNEKTTAENRLNDLKKEIGDGNEDELKQQIESGQQRLKVLRKELEHTDHILQQCLQLATFRADKANAESLLAQLKAQQESEDYKRQKQFVTFWDTTENVRREYHNLVNERQKQSGQKVRMEQGKSQFQTLANDLAGRIRQNRQTAEGLRRVNDWLQEKAPFDGLFTNAGTVSTQLDFLIKTQEQIQQISNEIAKGNEQLPQLQIALDAAVAEENTADAAVKAKDSEITARQTERDNLHPALLTEELNRTSARQKQLQDLQHLTGTQTKHRTDLEKITGEIAADEELLKQLTATKTLALSHYEVAKAKEREAANRYSVMSSSVDDTLTELRQQLRNADRCPLCGQTLENHTFESVDFQKMLTPLEIERQQTEKARQEAEERYSAALEKVTGQEAKMTEQRKRQKDLQALSDDTEKAIKDLLPNLSLTFNDHLDKQILDLLQEVQVHQRKLQAKQKQTEDLQLAINRLQKEKEVLLQVKNGKTQKVNDTRLAISKFQVQVQNFANQQQSLIQKQNDSVEELNGNLTGYFPDWKTDIALTKGKLEQEAAAYVNRKTRYEEEVRKLETSVVLCSEMGDISQKIQALFPSWETVPNLTTATLSESETKTKWTSLLTQAGILENDIRNTEESIKHSESIINAFYLKNNIEENELERLITQEPNVEVARNYLNGIETGLATQANAITSATQRIECLLTELGRPESEIPNIEDLKVTKFELETAKEEALSAVTAAAERLNVLSSQKERSKELEKNCAAATERYNRWAILDRYFGGDRFRNLVQTHILKPLLNNANNYLSKITDRYSLTCSESNEQLAILVLDRYNKNEMRSVTVLSGGERFMISLALSLALSSLNRPDLNINILFIDEGFGTLDEKSLDSVMQTLETLQEIAGQQERRVGVISHREELIERIPTQIQVRKRGEGRSVVVIR